MIIGIYCESASQSFHSLKTAAFGIKDKKSALLSPFFMTISLLKIIVAQEVHNGLKFLSKCALDNSKIFKQTNNIGEFLRTYLRTYICTYAQQFGTYFD